LASGLSMPRRTTNAKNPGGAGFEIISKSGRGPNVQTKIEQSLKRPVQPGVAKKVLGKHETGKFKLAKKLKEPGQNGYQTPWGSRISAGGSG